MIHPLDQTKSEFGGIQVPIGNYHQKVWCSLIDIMSDSQKISEKDFKRRDELKAMADRLIRSPSGEELIQTFISLGTRPEMCAEGLYFEMISKGKTASDENMAKSQLAGSPRTFKEAVKRG